MHRDDNGDNRFTCQLNPSNQLVSPDVIEVHYHYVQRALSDFLPGHVERERLVEHRVQSALEYRGLSLLDPFIAELQPHLYVRI